MQITQDIRGKCLVPDVLKIILKFRKSQFAVSIWIICCLSVNESQFHYFVILTVLYPCRLKSSIDMLPEVRSSQTLRRPTERLKAAFFSSFVSYTFIIFNCFSRCKSTNFLRFELILLLVVVIFFCDYKGHSFLW